MARQPFNTRWAQGVESEDNLNSFKTPGDVRISTGWEGGQDKDAPPAGQENWWHNRVDSALQGSERNGVMSWHPQAIYGLGAPTYGEDGNYYESTSVDNVGNNPVSTIGFWRYCGPSFFSGHSPGDLKMVAHNNVPTTGWLKCNGAILLRSSYQLLFSAIGTAHNTGGETSQQFRLPDLRGEFVRGFDDGRGIDAGRSFGSFQAGTTHMYLSQPSGDGAYGTTWSDALGSYHQSSKEETLRIPTTSNKAGQIYPAGTVYQLNPGVVEMNTFKSRPRNKTVNYWIKY